ncbi:hypothetical protein HPB52_000695 [Rhipicephalus sanguineus]|uniref:Uncharacterized protein n=1 Tax=Rhipicephalus sanguineus TaxID=34632 RepID=A0A9D4SRP5_RHISA|nr:hypothetical protein HPB52_000695 [Rhipicephalus sanguineus]
MRGGEATNYENKSGGLCTAPFTKTCETSHTPEEEAARHERQRYTANAMEKVCGSAALVKELAEKEGIAADEVTRMLRSRLMSVDGMHDFMRLTGVVKESVTCAPPVEGCSFQLQDLNNDCWRLVRRYLSFDDVKRFTVGKPDDTKAS